jgi:hypothetical protein
MIDAIDFQLPDPRLARAVRKVADATFMRSVDDLAADMLPRIHGYRPHLISNCCLRLRCVEPHRDDWQDPTTKCPRHYRALSVISDAKWVGLAVQYVRERRR